MRPAAATAVPCLQPLCLPMPCGPYSVWLVNIMRQPCRARRWRVAVQLVRSVQDTSGPRPGPLGPEGIPADALATLFGSAGDTDESAVCSRSFLGLSRCRCGRGEPSPGADLGGMSPVGADVGGASPVALNGCRCGRRARRHLRFVLRAVRAAGALHSPAPTVRPVPRGALIDGPSLCGVVTTEVEVSLRCPLSFDRIQACWGSTLGH